MAVPNPQRELGRLRDVVQRGLPPFVLVLGPARFFRSEAVDLCVGAVRSGIDLRTVDGEQSTDGRELDDLRGAGLFAAGTALVVRRGDKWIKEHAAALEAVLPRIGRGCHLVLECAKLDGRTKLAKSLAAAGEKFEFRDLYTEPYDRTRSPADAEVVGWIQERGRAVGVPLAQDGALALLWNVGKDPAELVAELGRLAPQFPGRKAALTAADLRGKLTQSFESTPFELAEALLASDRRRCERSLAAMYARGVKGREGDTTDAAGLFPFITSWLYTSLAQVYEGRCLFDDGTPLRDVPAALGVRVFGDRLIDQVEGNSRAQLERGLVLLVTAQRELRTTGEEPDLILLRFVSRFLATAARPKASQTRR